MSQATGQAAFYTNYIAPSGTGSGANTSDFGFFTLGMNATLDINTNIQHLQLGCGGVNGPGCDIDMENVSLSGNLGTAGCPAGASNVAGCDAKITNPFLRLAIKNPTSLSTRQISGVQFGAQSVLGLLQAGQNTTSANGIKTLSGYMKVQSTGAANTLTGTISTAPAFFPVYNPGTGSGNYTISGNLQAKVLGIPAATAGFTLTSGGFWIPGFSGINFSVPAPTVNGNRISQLTVNPSASLPNVVVGYKPDDNDCGFLGAGACNTYGTPANNPNFQPGNTIYPSTGTAGTQGGPVVATSTSCSGVGCILLSNFGVGLNFNTHMYGQVNNVSANVQFIQPLGFIHSIPLNSPLSLSLQSQSISWPDAASDDIAQKGWWMSVKNPVLVGNLTPSAPVSLCPDASSSATCVFPQFAKQFNDFLAANTLTTSDLVSLLTGGTLGASFGALNLTPISLTLNGVQLSTQNTVPNCYGGLKFC
ncbi:hypothetical protein [Aquirhabdus sp.]|uniref:hypothetical protein n=1 Tax=Aquirhabdus sp. TaxID=2824160 RepID=UPI00396C6C7E